MQSRLQPYFTACAHRILQHLNETGIFSLVDDQEKALRCYTPVLGFVKDKDIPMGSFRCLTVNSPEGAPGVELVLEPMSFPPAQTYQKALFAAGVPATRFLTEDIQAEFAR